MATPLGTTLYPGPLLPTLSLLSAPINPECQPLPRPLNALLAPAATIWSFRNDTQRWVEGETLEGHAFNSAFTSPTTSE